MPSRTMRYYAEKGRYKSLEKVPSQITLFDDAVNEDADNYEAMKINAPYIIPKSNDDRSEAEVMEILNKVANNFIEKRVIQLRVEGYTYQEIGPLVGYSKSSISIMLQDIEKRFDKMYKESS